MRRSTFLFLLTAAGLTLAQTQSPRQPKLVLSIMVDQFRYDYLTRFGSEYTGGLKRLWQQGAVFTNAHYEAAPTVTAVGHSTVLTGATPSLSGIVGNDWWDRESGKRVTSVSDESTQLLGSQGAGSSPRRLLQSSVGDELKMSGKGGKVIGISLKDRSSILPAGRMGDAAYWFDGRTGNFVSSTYYFAKLPVWVEAFNAEHRADKLVSADWIGHKLPTVAGPQLYAAVDATPFSDDLLQQLALSALKAENLGSGPKVDLLAISYSATDYVGHRYGPDSPEVHGVVTHVDKLIGELIQAAEAQAGAGNVVVVFTADHGVAPVPEINQQRNMPGGRLDWNKYRAAVEQALTEKFGPGQWIAYSGSGVVYLNSDPIPGKKVDLAEVQEVAASALRSQPHVARVYTRSQLARGAVGADVIDNRVRNGFNSARAADIFTVVEPYYIFEATGASHGSPYDYDAHVPVIFFGDRIKPGMYNRSIAVQDIAPTLSTLLGIETPSGSTGRVLDEILR